MLVPVIGLVGAFVHARADRYTYLSQIGLSIAVGWGVWGFYQSRQDQRPADWRRWGLAAVSAASVLALAIVAEQQTSYWQSGQTIWERATACDPHNAMAHQCLAGIYAREGRTDEAISHARQALASDTIARYVTVDAELTLAECLMKQQKAAEALEHFQQAVRLAPYRALCHTRLAIALAQTGNLDRAIPEFREALRLEPDSVPARIDLANVLLAKGEAHEAAQLCREVLKLDPRSAQAATLLRGAEAAGAK